MNQMRLCPICAAENEGRGTGDAPRGEVGVWHLCPDCGDLWRRKVRAAELDQLHHQLIELGFDTESEREHDHPPYVYLKERYREAYELAGRLDRFLHRSGLSG